MYSCMYVNVFLLTAEIKRYIEKENSNQNNRKIYRTNKMKTEII